MKISYADGSKWRKWDLHVHTPLSIIQHYGGDDDEVWSKFITNLEELPNEFSVIGINDYLFIDGYKKITEYKQKGKLKNIDLILPLLEFRLSKFAGTDQNLKKINFHVIFSNDISHELIQAQFINALSPKFKLQSGIEQKYWSGLITRDSVADLGKKIKETVPEDKVKDYGTDIQEGFNNLVLDEDDILKVLESPFFYKNGYPLYLTAVGKTEWDSLTWNNQSIAIKKDVINKVNFVFTAGENVEKCLAAKNKLKQNRVNDLLLDCSDAHHFSDSVDKDRIGNSFTWIKGDPTFEGLEYIIHEPDERVKICKQDPNHEFLKPYFSKIVIQKKSIFAQKPIKFLETELNLHSGLVAIIGGRGEGKSLLLDAIAKTFCKQKNVHRKDDISMNDGFSITYNKSTGEHQDYNIADGMQVIYLHVHQKEVQEIVENVEKLSKVIEDMLGISSTNDQYTNEDEIKSILSEINECKEWLIKHDQSKFQTIIDNRTQLISTIRTNRNSNIIEKYTENILGIKNKEKHIKRLIQLKTKFENTVSEVNKEINAVNSELQESLTPINFTQQLKFIEDRIEHLRQISGDLVANNIQIKDALVKEEIEGDPTTLLQKVNEYRTEIEKAQSILTEISHRKLRLESLIDKRNQLIDQHDSRLNDEVDSINSKWNEKRQGSPDLTDEQKELIKKLIKSINIYGEIDFNSENFFNSLKDCLNLGKFRRKSDVDTMDRIKSAFPCHSYDSFKRFIKNESIINLDDCKNLEELLELDYFNQNGQDKLLKMLFCDSERHRYLKTLAKIKYQDKTPDELSIGQRGTLLLSLKLATESFFDPIIIDQPEDDLDNQFIVKDLVPILKTIKKYRQVIIATHNANLVVNADAEQVIVADNKSESLSYTSGSLENPEIRKRICMILEGGENAFRQRERKYGFR
jgi:energy-coupling factor transporter ATP-binding protein EcfA2